MSKCTKCRLDLADCECKFRKNAEKKAIKARAEAAKKAEKQEE